MKCILCQRPVPDERRWWERMTFVPPRRMCPPTVDCYMGFAQRIGVPVSQQEARNALTRHGVDPDARNRDSGQGR